MSMLFIDHFGNLTRQQALSLQKSGISGIVTYLCAHTHPTWGKGVTPDALALYKSIGWKVCFNYEGDPTSAHYFTIAQAQSDAHDALAELEWLGIAPNPNIVVYFSVDYDVQTRDDAAIVAYFKEIVRIFNGKFAIGAYGGINILQVLSDAHIGVTHFWQTIAWSYGRLFAQSHLYQNRVNTDIDGIPVDVDKVLANPGYYPPDPPPQIQYSVISEPFDDADKASQAAMSISKLGYSAEVKPIQ